MTLSTVLLLVVLFLWILLEMVLEYFFLSPLNANKQDRWYSKIFNVVILSSVGGWGVDGRGRVQARAACRALFAARGLLAAGGWIAAEVLRDSDAQKTLHRGSCHPARAPADPAWTVPGGAPSFLHGRITVFLWPCVVRRLLGNYADQPLTRPYRFSQCCAAGQHALSHAPP